MLRRILKVRRSMPVRWMHDDQKPKGAKDSLFMRIAGSDWSDRRGQPISLTMKLYWVVFVGVVGTGLFKHFTSPPGIVLVLYLI